MDDIETGWLLEKGDPPDYLMIDHGFWRWTADPKKALRLSRREDGEALATIIEDAIWIREHHFG